jgi:hypothetical protein
MPIEIDGTELDEIPVGPDELDEIRVDGTTVYQSETPIDIFDREDLGYHIGDTGVSTLPQIQQGEGYDNDNALWFDYGIPNNVTNLSPDNSGYNSSNQDVDLDNYLEPGDIAEIIMRPASWSQSRQFRFAFFADGYYPSNHIRLRFTQGYFRLEQGSDYYGGTSSAESYTGFTGLGNWHRLVIDASDFPYIECHLWDIDNDEFVDTVSGEESNPDTDEPGHQLWWNEYIQLYISDYRLIDENDFSV